MNEIIAVALVTILAVISPGADFALITRNSYLYGRRLGIYTAFGIACGVWIHISYSLIGLSFLKNHIPNLIQLIQYIGASYLIYIGYKTYIQRPIILNEDNNETTHWKTFQHGFLTNSLNPKTTLSVMSIYSQIMTSENSLTKLFAYGIYISGMHLLWFCLIALFCSSPVIRNKILAQQHNINRIIGIILGALGLSLFLTNL